jgi:hypothetical protein
MYARIASFEGGDIERMREMNEERISSGTMNFPEGMRRAMALATPDGQRRLFVTFFDSRDAIEAASEQFEQMGDEIPEDVRGRRTAVDVYEVLFDQEV